MPRSCAFCGGSPTAREHVWPRWARDVWSAEGQMPHFQQVVQHDRDDIERSWRQDACSMTVTAVCARCNNEWMSDLERESKADA